MTAVTVNARLNWLCFPFWLLHLKRVSSILDFDKGDFTETWKTLILWQKHDFLTSIALDWECVIPILTSMPKRPLSLPREQSIAGFLIQVMQSWLIDHFFKGIKERKERERVFLENGSKVLEKLVASCNGKSVPLHTFSAQELCQATNNYCENLVWSWYKGSLEEWIVLVKRFLDSIEWTDFFIINDIVQMCDHDNVLKPIWVLSRDSTSHFSVWICCKWYPFWSNLCLYIILWKFV